MTIDEHRLGRRLEQSPGRVSTAWLPTVKLSRQIGRRRSRVIPAIAGPVVAAGAVAVAVGAVLSASNWQPSGRRPPRPPRLSYTITANGQTQVYGPNLELPSYAVSPGKDLPITVDATIPEGATVTSLWLGITDDILTPGRDGPHNMTPVLAASTDTTLGPGVHRLSFSWAVPAELPLGARRQLSVQLAWRTQSQGMSQQFIAKLEVQASPDA